LCSTLLTCIPNQLFVECSPAVGSIDERQGPDSVLGQVLTNGGREESPLAYLLLMIPAAT
jgi:hypothetical protein